MASHNIVDRRETNSPLEIGHKPQHRHDSGAYIDWNMDESYANYVGPKIKDPATYNSNVTGGFVTVVAVEQNPSMEKPPCPFVTVLAINDDDKPAPNVTKDNGDSELVLLYRLPGERLGLGLKFEGGVKSTEKVDKLFIQSCALNSPASRSKASWGYLAAGDDILAIDEIPVNSMTRIECVRCLKESSVVIKLLIKPNHSAQRPSSVDKDSAVEQFVMSESIPPPVPPRKFRKNSLQSGSVKSEALSNISLLVHPPEDFADRTDTEPPPCEKCKASPKALPRHSFPGHSESGEIQESHVYTDLTVTGDDSEVTVIESESDDTGSSMSTVIDRASSGPTTSNSSFSEVRSTTSAEAAFDAPRAPNSTCSTVYLDRVLEPFLQLEREFSSSAVIEDITLFNKLVAAASIAEGKPNTLPVEDNLNDSSQISVQPPENFQDLQSESDAVMTVNPRRTNLVSSSANESVEVAPVLPPKPLPRKDIQNQKGKFKSGKKRPPPPPPPVKLDRPLPVPEPPAESSESYDAKEEEGFNDLDHLPRLIDFVPKDRTDVIVPNAIHASAKHQDQVEMLIERHKLLDIISTSNDNRVAVKDFNVASALIDTEESPHIVSEQCRPVDEHTQSTQSGFDPFNAPVSTNEDQLSVGGEAESNDKILPENRAETRQQFAEVANDLESIPKNGDVSSQFIADHHEESPCSAAQENTGVSKTMDSLLAISSSSSTTHSLPPPPSFSRLPPDGHEFPFPPSYQETGPLSLSNSVPSGDGDNAVCPISKMKLICPPELSSTKHNSYYNGAKSDEPPAATPRNFSHLTPADGFKIKMGSASWRNDEKSEKSVRDKIAMFSHHQNEESIPTVEGNLLMGSKKLNRFKSSEDVCSQNDLVDCAFGSSVAKSFSRSYVNVNKIGNHSDRSHCQSFSRNVIRRSPDFSETTPNSRSFILNSKLRSSPPELDFGARTQNTVELALSSSSSAYSSCSPESSLSPTSSHSYVIGSSCTLPRKNDDSCLEPRSSTMTRVTSFSGGMRPHNRSQSLIDVGNLQNRYPGDKPFSSSDATNRQASLNNLIEQRRRSMSKLRGLVIPEKVSEIANLNQTILDLPEIKTEIKINCPGGDNDDRNSKSNNVNYPLKNRFNSLTNQQNDNFRRNSSNDNYYKDSSHLANLYSPQTKENLGSGRSWKSQLPTNEIPKYSPAFKRKSLTLCNKPTLSSNFNDRNQVKSCDNSNKVSSLSRKLPTSLNPRPYSCLNGNLSDNISKADKVNSSYDYAKRFETKKNGYLISTSLNTINDTKSKLDYGETIRDGGGGDSDSDSAVSSSRSSISPPMSPMPEPNCHHLNEADDPSRHLVASLNSNNQKTLHRTLSSDTTASATSSTTSTLTSGSQASCSSNGASSGGLANDSLSRRVLKPQSVEAINRKNVLTSAKYSCGLDAKIGSPLIQRKFVEDHASQNSGNTSNTNGDDFASDLEFLNYLEKTVCPPKSSGKTEVKPESRSGNGPVYYQLADAVDGNVEIAYIEITATPATEAADQPAESDFESEQSGSQEDSLTSETSQNSSLANLDARRDQIDLSGNCEPKNPFIFRPKSSNRFEESNDDDSDSTCPLIKKLSKEFNLPINDVDLSDSDQSKDSKPELNVKSARNSRNNDLSPEPNYRSGLSHVDETKNTFLSHDGKEPSSKSVVSSRTPINAHRSVSVNDIRKAFEKPEQTVTPPGKSSLSKVAHHARVSSLDSTASDDSLLPPYGSVSNLHREQFGSISSLASSTSLISQQELQQLIEDANQTAEEAGGEGSGHEVAVIVLHRDVPGASIGITLAGGADYETKEITVHKVLAGSPADRDGRIQKGDRILSINGRSMKDATHREALSTLKAPRFEVVLVVSHWRHKNGDVPVSNVEPEAIARVVHPSRAFRKLIEDSRAERKISDSDSVKYDPPVTVTLIKDGAGLGFSLEGGKDSPLGDQPLTVKKIFSGGCAEKCGQLSIGDELLKVNDTDVTVMTRIEAWSLMKRLENGKVTLSVRHVSERKEG